MATAVRIITRMASLAVLLHLMGASASASASLSSELPEPVTDPTVVRETAAIVQDFFRKQNDSNSNGNHDALRHSNSNDNRDLQSSITTFPVYVHVMLENDAQTAGTAGVTEAAVRASLNHLNNIFASQAAQVANFRFELAAVQRRIRPEWHYCHHSEQDRSMRRTLHQGNAQTLNIYVCDSSQSQFNGWARFPWETAGTDHPLNTLSFLPEEDGITVGFDAFPTDDTDVEYNEMLLTHEVGHFLGLFHTYENGCTSPGDGVADTPAHARGSLSCYIGTRNTCPDNAPALVDPGDDPLTNIMNQVPSSCRQEFTPGQVQRIQALTQEFRSVQIALSGAAAAPRCLPEGSPCQSHSDCCSGYACTGPGTTCFVKLKIEIAIAESHRNRLKEANGGRARLSRGNRQRQLKGTAIAHAAGASDEHRR